MKSNNDPNIVKFLDYLKDSNVLIMKVNKNMIQNKINPNFFSYLKFIN